MVGRHPQKSLNGKKISTYVLYIFGEMSLLVIGILVALQIDNWNEQRKESILEAQYYCRLYESSLQDKVQIDQLQSEMNDRLVASIDMLAGLQAEIPERHYVASKMLAAIRLSGTDFHPDTSAFEDIKSSGNLNLLKDTEIKDKISKYYIDVTAIAINHSRNANFMIDTFFEQENYTGSGWLNLKFMKAALVGSDVDIENLVNRYPLTEKIVDTLINDALVYVAINGRGTAHIQDILNHVKYITQVLDVKCDDEI